MQSDDTTALQYITNDNGERISVVMPVAQFEAIIDALEDAHDLMAVHEQREEPTISDEEFIRELPADGTLTEPGSDEVLRSLEIEGISLADLRVCR